MSANFLWGTVGSVAHLLTTELNSLTSGSLSGYGPEIDFQSGGSPGGQYELGDLLFKLASSSAALTASSYIAVYFVIAPDGTNYPKLSGNNLAKGNYFAGILSLYPATLSSEVIYEAKGLIKIPRGKFKTVLENQSGVTLPASGNTLDLYPTPEQY